ncbi:ral guanine nucleotide dissociation stimulator-like, partial [Perognathus longimembris pacificus]
ACNACAPGLAQDSAAAWRPQQESHYDLANVKEQAPSTSGHSELDWAAVPAQEPYYPPLVSREIGHSRKVPPALNGLPQLMSEQLTRMDVELFVKAEPNQCLGSMWSRRYNKGKPRLAPSIQVILIHFNKVVSLVTTHCLGDLSMNTSVRAHLLEFWIQAAEGCRVLRNFSSLHAIMSALQSRAISRLHRSWQQVSRKDLLTFQKLAEITSPENNYSKSRELLLKETRKLAKLLKGGPRQSKKMGMIKGIVPYLRIFLKDFLVVHLAYVDAQDEKSKEKNLIREIEILDQMRELQRSCRFYNIRVDHHFTEWFRGLERLSKDASYELSCTLEPCSPTDCPSKKRSAIGNPDKNGGSQPLQMTFLQRTKKKLRACFSFLPRKRKGQNINIISP